MIAAIDMKLSQFDLIDCPAENGTDITEFSIHQNSTIISIIRKFLI